MTTAAPSTALATIQPALHRSRTARPCRVPGRVPGADPRGVRARLAPIHDLVPCPLPGLVRRPPRRHRELRPGSGRQGPRPATVTRRLCTITGFHKYAVEEELLEH